jgi:hypothetical protein
MEDSQLAQNLALWMLAVLIIAVVRWRRHTATAGLILAYVFDLWLIHWLAPAFSLLPWYQNPDFRLMEAGVEQSLYGIAAFAFGSVFAAPFLIKTGLLSRSSEPKETDRRLPFAYVCTGGLFYLLLSTSLKSLPSASSIISTGQQLLVVGVGLCCWQAWRDGNRRHFTLWIGAALAFPFITILTRGFIGYGAGAAVCVLIFVSTFIRSRLRVVAAGLLVCYLGLSVFVSYMRDRGQIRASVWGGESLNNRLGTLANTADTFEWFDLTNVDHLKRLDSRLNQNILVGAAVQRMTDQGGYAHGQTLFDSLLALIPRALWPDKPMVAGSGTVVTQYTGIQFAVGTSIGVGQVMEFYINFGTWGVIIGFALIGTLITIIDVGAAQSLAKGDLHGFVLWYLPGISLLQVGGSMIEVTTSAVASFVVALIANKYLERVQRKHVVETALTGHAAEVWTEEPADA